MARERSRMNSGGFGPYGTCAECSKAIAPARLKAIPEATTCVSCQEKLERGDA